MTFSVDAGIKESSGEALRLFEDADANASARIILLAVETVADILIIEDDPSINEVVCAHLERRGYRCRQAFSGTEGLMLLREQRLRFALDDCAEDYDVCIVDCSPTMKRLAFNAYLAAAGEGMVIVPVKLDSTVMRGTALTVSAIESISDALRVPTPEWRILRTCVPGLMTNAEATGAAVLDEYFPDRQFSTVIHASSKVCEGSWQWQPVTTFKPDSRPAKDYEALAEEVFHG